jgi:hypothetical protein
VTLEPGIEVRTFHVKDRREDFQAERAMCTKIQPGKKLKSPVPQKAEDEMRE